MFHPPRYAREKMKRRCKTRNHQQSNLRYLILPLTMVQCRAVPNICLPVYRKHTQSEMHFISNIKAKQKLWLLVQQENLAISIANEYFILVDNKCQHVQFV